MKGLPREAACSSPFAVTDYSTHKDFGGDEALQRLKERCHKHGLRLMVRLGFRPPPHGALLLQLQSPVESKGLLSEHGRSHGPEYVAARPKYVAARRILGIFASAPSAQRRGAWDGPLSLAGEDPSLWPGRTPLSGSVRLSRTTSDARIPDYVWCLWCLTNEAGGLCA